MDETTAAGKSGALAALMYGGQLGLGTGAGSLSVPMPFESRIVLCEDVRIAGTAHTPNVDDVMAKMPDDAGLTLVREPGNMADRWAIRVEYQGRRLGFVPADRNEVLARLMDGGKALRGSVVSRERQGTWWKVSMEVVLVD